MKLGTEGVHFTLDGRISVYSGLNDFRLFKRFVDKEDVMPIIQDRLDLYEETDKLLPIKTLRILSRATRLFSLKPGIDYPYDSITAFTDFLNKYGFIPDWEALADCMDVSLDDQKHHWEKMIKALEPCEGKALSLGNEWDVNGWRPENFNGLRAPFTCSKGSGGAGVYPDVSEKWDYHKYHTRRDGLKGLAASGRYLIFVVGGDSEAPIPYPGTFGPTIIDEYLGAADHAERNRRSNRPKDFYNAALDTAIWGAGGSFHSQNGINSEPFSDTQYSCGLAHLMGLTKPDPVQQFDGTCVN